MKRIITLTASIILILVIIIFIAISYQNNIDTNNISEEPDDNDTIIEPEAPDLTVELDRENKTVTILAVENGTDLFWYNVELVNGTATLPGGSIEVGDMIVNCTEILDFRWIPTDELFLHCKFVRGDT